MALITCPECGARISDQAENCPHCGLPRPAERLAIINAEREKRQATAGDLLSGIPMWAKIPAALAAVVASIVIIVGVVMGYYACRDTRSSRSYAESYEEAEDSKKLTAKLGAFEVVKKNLKSPSSSRLVDQDLLETSGDSYLYRVEVDSQNSFGAQVRSTWLVCLSVKSDSPDRYHWNDQVGALEVSRNGPTPEEIKTFKELNGWK